MPGTTPVYGFPYPEPTDLVADYPALGQDLAEDIEAVLPTLGGLSASVPTSLANSGGTATLSGNTVTFTGVTSVSLNGCFTSTYDNYRIIVTGTQSNTANTMVSFRLRAAGTDLTSSVYRNGTMTNPGGTSYSAVYNASVTLADMATGGNIASEFVYDLTHPNQAQLKTFAGLYYGESNGSTALGFFGGRVNQATAYTGITFLVASGTMTGTVSVYGYKK